MDILEFTLNIINSAHILFLTKIVAFLCKFYLFTILLTYVTNKKTNSKSIFLLSALLLSALIGDIYWCYFTLCRIDILVPNHNLSHFLDRFLDLFNIILHLCTSLFIESLLPQQASRYQLFKTARMIAGGCLGIFFICTAFINELDDFSHETIALRMLYFYIMIIGLQTIYNATYIIQTQRTPRLLKHQLKIFIYTLITPFLALKLLTVNPFTFAPNNILTNYPFISLTTILLTYAIYFCAKKLIGLRFLNVKDHVETVYNLNFVKDFKKTLGDLSHVSNVNELKHISLQFFKNMFETPQETVHFYIRNNDISEQPDDQKHLAIERFLSLGTSDQRILVDFLYHSKILIRDEIEFSAFYEEKAGYAEAIDFMRAINADLFLPIYDKKKLIAYILIDHNARPRKFYNNVERDEMLVFAAYVSSIINLVRNRNFDALLAQEKELKEELYTKHQEINQYKESIRSFFRNSQDRKVGILFYKNRRFIFGNQTAQEFLACDPGIHRGHPVVQLLKKLIKNVQSYQTAQSASYQGESKKIIINALPHMESNDIIFTLYHPDVNDTIKMQADMLKDPSHWDYLLYLETTESGQLINQLIPGHGEILLNFKIDLLKIALNKKATLLCLPSEDILQTAELIHAISLRKEFSAISLTEPEKEYVHAIKLFGINPLLTGGAKPEPLLEKLDTSGTLFIANIHFLALETQEALADFIKYGAFHVFKSDQRIASDVRIICSSIHDLSVLVEKGLFSRTLLQELKKTSLKMPSLTTLSATEFKELSENVMRQALKAKSIEPMLTLSDREKEKLHSSCPTSLHELRKKIYSVLLEKSHKQDIEDSLEITAATLSSDPEMTAIINLGKDALKDRKMMEYLWHTFDKNQTKIAALLGVNRSSVNRRCKDYHLL